ncbi:DUF6153 family protein [Streptomyces sp. NPDC085481]|uniref:DUF6153 family protein n=1 Tax=Streptomyces sp. NPDC085481 TaxID=3365727 RepID=UPI0037D72753
MGYWVGSDQEVETLHAHPRTRRSSTRAGGAPAHLLLVVVLALGVFVMHSVGHPEGSSGGGTEGTTHASSAPAHHGGDSTGSPPGPASESSPKSSSHDSGMAMDMTTLCVAVLGIWLLAGLVRAALCRHADWTALLAARLLPSSGPNAPPPRPPDLARLSVLRI